MFVSEKCTYMKYHHMGSRCIIYLQYGRFIKSGECEEGARMENIRGHRQKDKTYRFIKSSNIVC